MRRVHLSRLGSLAGTAVGRSAPLEITQAMVDGFAEATFDRQWIHVDPHRAAQGPFGGTIAHGFLTLSLVPYLVSQVLQVEGTELTVNYGLNRVRFPAPVPVGATVTADVTVADVTALDGGAKQVVNRVTVTVEGGDKPSCVAESVLRHYPASG